MLRHVFLALLATSAISGCELDPFGGQTCTLIGCTDGLRVAFEGSVPEGTVVEATADTGETRTLECGVDALCVYGAFFEGFTPGRVTVRVVTPSGETTEDFDPRYEAHQPNGPDCPPTCVQAEVTVQLPEVSAA